jgi:hypothetical protein
MSTLEKVCVSAAVIIASFCAGFYVSDLRWESKYDSHLRAEAQAALQKKQQFDEERRMLEARTAGLRSDLDDALSASDKLREQVRMWSSRAKTAESRFAVQCLSLVEEERRLRLEGATIIRWCREALPNKEYDAKQRAE